jgi:hypothetical protein
MPQSVTINPAGEVLDTTKSASYRVHVSGREFVDGGVSLSLT